MDHVVRSVRRLKSKRIIIVILLVLASFAIITSLFPQERALSPEDMRDYARVFIETYSSEIDFFFLRYRKHFPFYSSESYSAKAIISRMHGVALLLEPSERWHFEYEMTEKSVEDAIYGGDWSTWPLFIVY